MKKQWIGFWLLMFIFNTAYAVMNLDKIPEKKRTPQGKYLTAKQAYKMIKGNTDNILFIDVRTRAEVEFVGMTNLADANIPFLVNDPKGWNMKKNIFRKAPNSKFSAAFNNTLHAKGLNKNSKIVLMCRSGTRSSKAARFLSTQGFKNVYSVVDGFEGDKARSGPDKGHRVVNGWKNSNLPWSYKLSKSKMYFE